MAAMAKYSRAPLVETVLEFRYVTPITLSDVTKLKNAFQKRYPIVEDLQDIEVQIQNGQVKHRVDPTGFNLRSSDALDLIMVNKANFAVIRTAPYPGWDAFSARANDELKRSFDVLGHRAFQRLGSRSVNRIDVPNSWGDLSVHTILNIGFHITLPFETDIYDDTISLTLRDKETAAIIRFTATPHTPMLIDHTSFIVDMDAFFDKDVPLREEDIWMKLNILHDRKNILFETVITDKLRELFQ